jgi:hypothetical protein
MAGIQGIGAQGAGLDNQGGVGGVDRLGIGGQQGGGSPLDQIKQLFEQLLQKVLESGQQAQGAQQPQGAQQAQSGNQAAAEGGVEDLMEKLRQMAKENPEAFKQALAQNPAFMAVAQAALSGGGGGGSVGKM